MEINAEDFSRKSELEAFLNTMHLMSDEDVTRLEEVYRNEVGTNDYFREKYRIIKEEQDSRANVLRKDLSSERVIY